MQNNHPDLWKKSLPLKTASSHKYTHGHALIYAAPELTGATRLAAEACARMGAGLVSVLADEKTAPVYRASLPAHILVRDHPDWFDDRVSARLYGPGGLSTSPDFESELATVLDADALYDLPAQLSPNFILTPHAGEFEKNFSAFKGSASEKAKAAAEKFNAHIILKGAETIIAAPDGRLVCNRHASPWLASAGSGDVLAGMITGLTAQGMEPFDAACAAVWIHGDCALRFGAGLVASDLPDLIPVALKSLYDSFHAS